MTTGGKSTLARLVFLSAAEPRYIIDPQASDITAVPGAVTFADPYRMPEAGTVRFVPPDPADLDAYNEVYRRIRDRVLRAVHDGRLADAHAYIWNDEAGWSKPAERPPRWGRAITIAGAKLMIGEINIHVRVRGVERSCVSQARHIGIWPPIGLEEDLKYLAGTAGLPQAELEEQLGRCEPHGFVWVTRDAGVNHYRVCEPVAA
ncbi:MAG TPA: hypothetical protein VFD01_16995 [Candidatus Dormibacteraeota bacterium]|nr:hypothetical protein [Candidatus Dormibacteraeota bacterium]